MQPTMCSRCHKHVAVVFITKLEGGQSKNEGLCLKCAKELGIKPIDDMIQKMGITDEDLENLTNRQFRERYGSYAFSWRGKKVLLRNLDLVEQNDKSGQESR